MYIGIVFVVFVAFLDIFAVQKGQCMPFGVASSSVVRPGAVPAVPLVPGPAPIARALPVPAVRPWLYGVAPHPSNYNPQTYWNNFYYQYYPQGFGGPAGTIGKK